MEKGISPGILQTLISTARSMLPWLNALPAKHLHGTRHATTTSYRRRFLNDWLINAGRSILVGAAYIRQGYNLNGTRFDLPLVGSAYNHGHPESDAASPWGLNYYGNYVESAAPVSNAAATFFNTNPPVAPAVRFMR